MPREIHVPAMGESVVEATVGKWLKQPGDGVETDEPVVELETEKVNLEVGAPVAGTLGSIVAPEGATVRVGDLLGQVNESAERTGATTTAAAASGSAAPAAPAAAPAETGGGGPDGSTTATSVPPRPAQGEASDAETATRPPTSPSVRRVAAEHDVDLGRVTGSGPGGRIVMDDVLAFLEKQRQETARPAPATGPPETAPPTARPAQLTSPTEEAPTNRREERTRMSRRRATIARRLLEAQRTTASLTTFNEIDMAPVMELRSRRKQAVLDRHAVKLGFMSFFVKAAVAALRAFPHLNAQIDGEDIVVKRYYDIGIAVSTEDGLVVPVLRDADRLSFVEVERSIEELARRARDGKLTLADLSGGTFTITNGGVFGSLLSTPILNPPQVGILGMHRIAERPMAVDGQVQIRPMMYVALTYDHRLVDGREAVQFLVRMKELLEDPESLMLEG